MYVKGTENARADALSRCPDYDVAEHQPGYNILESDKDGNLVPAQRSIRRMYRATIEIDEELIQEYETDTMAQTLKGR